MYYISNQRFLVVFAIQDKMSQSVIRNVLESNSIYLKQSIYTEIDMLRNKHDKHTHIAFLLDKNNNVLSYKSNVFFKTNSFPFSQHAEINTIINYYSKQDSKKINNGTKKLVVAKLGPNCFRMSKPCRQCANFIANNWNNLKLKEVLYSNNNGELVSLTKAELLNSDEFCLSSANNRYNMRTRKDN